MSYRIVGCGGYLPEKILTNSQLELSVDTTDEWIKSRTGIAQRHIAAEGECSSHMAFAAAKAALNDADLPPEAIDLIIVCTTTPDNSFPSTATKLQGYFSLKNVPSFDLQAVCSGFIYGLQVAGSLLDTKKYNTILLVCAEKMSSLLDWNDRGTCVLFGDGAGAVIIKNDQESNISSGMIDSIIHSDGSHYDLLYTDGGVSSNGQSGKIRMQGSVLFKNAVEKMTESTMEILLKNNLTVDDVDFFIPHQANIRIIQAISERLKLDEKKLVTTIATHANCSAASIPLALERLKLSGNLAKGKLIVFTAFGAGLTWGSAIVRW